MVPTATPPGGGHVEQSRPGMGATLYCFIPLLKILSVFPGSQSLFDYHACLVRFFANLFASAFPSESSLDAFFLSGFQVKRVALDLFNNVFLLHLALKTAQGVFEGFSLLQSNFRQTDTPPNPSGRTE
jgi:hypothetical protein